MLTADPADAVVDLTRQLVAFDSVNPGLVPGAVGEGPIAQFTANRLSDSGFEVQLVPAPSDPRRMSVIAVRDGARPGRTVVLNGHLDTVGVDGMAEPFTARIDGDRMSGRGASDMKGGRRHRAARHRARRRRRGRTRHAPRRVRRCARDPSYIGTRSDIAVPVAAAHAAGVPLVVDAAWAAHFGFSPAVPPHALTLGADVLITSAHKTLPAWSQGALLLARTRRSGGLLDPGRLERGFDAAHTTSPAGAILASTDAARALLQQHGADLVGRLVELVRGARDRLAAVPGLAVVTDRPDGHSAGPLHVDPAKLVVLLAGTGAHGHAVEADLLAAGILLEMADRDVLVPMVTVSDDGPSVARLVDTLVTAIEKHRGEPRQAAPAAAWTVEPATATDPPRRILRPPRNRFRGRSRGPGER